MTMTPIAGPLLSRLADFCRRNALAVFVAGLALAGLSAWVAAERLGVSTDTDLMFSEKLAWRQQAAVMDKDFPQFRDLLVVVIDARIPEEADATAAELTRRAATEKTHFLSVRRPDASPFLERNGLLFLEQPQLVGLLDRTIDAQPFLGQLVADPSSRGLFAALSLLGMGVDKGDADLTAYLPAIDGFHQAMAAGLAGKPSPLSWQALLGGGLSDLAGPYRFVLIQPKQDFGALEPGGAATEALRTIIADLEFVKAGTAHVRITGQVALADEEFATVAHGAVEGLIVSVMLITLWLFLALRSWRLILPVLMTLGLGLMLTVLFAALAVRTLNLVSVGFGVLFVGIAVDFAIQFCVRYREQRFALLDAPAAMRFTAGQTGDQILVAALATAVGFLAFVPTDFSGVAELGLIAGFGMLLAFVCTLTFLPAAMTLFRSRGETAEVGFVWARPLDIAIAHNRFGILTVFAALAVTAGVASTRLTFDSDPLHTKDASTEAMVTLLDLINNPLTNPYSIDILVANAAEAERLTTRLRALPSVGQVMSLDSFVPDDQAAKLALIADAASILAPTLTPPAAVASVTAEDIRMAAKAALAHIVPALPKLAKDHPLVAIADDLRKMQTASDAVLLATNAALTRFLPGQLTQLRNVLSADPVDRSMIPADIARDWTLPDGRMRIQVTPATKGTAGRDLEVFVAEVATVAPNAGGSAVTIQATSKTIVGAFRSAAIYALIAITVLLFAALRRVADVAMVMAPLLLSAALTVLIAVALPLPMNFANIIALPLLLGVGVSFNIYFVMNWRAGLGNPLGSATARAIIFSALTTGSAFGSLAMSDHPGTASMGLLLLISLGCTLLVSLICLPALLAISAPVRRQ